MEYEKNRHLLWLSHAEEHRDGNEGVGRNVVRGMIEMLKRMIIISIYRLTIMPSSCSF